MLSRERTALVSSARPDKAIAMRLFSFAALTLGLAASACGPDRGINRDGSTTPDGTSSDGSSIDVTTNDVATSDVAAEAAAMCPTMGAEISGIVTAPNAEDPIPGAVVYLTATMPAAQPDGVSCDRCDLPAGVLAYSTSDARGRWSFVRGVNASGTFFLVVQKGRFRKVSPLTVRSCVATTVPAAATRLPGSRMEGEIPRILVASGTTQSQLDRPNTGDWTYDDIGRVLRRIGVTEFDRAEPCRQATNTTNVTTVDCPFGSILADNARLRRYNVIVAPCGALGFNHSWQVLDNASNRVIATNVRDWLRLGGRLYTSDTAYGLLARSAPSLVTFAGGTTLSLSRDPANIGVGGSPSTPRMYTGRVNDDALRTWLSDRGSLAMDGSIALTGFISPWVAIDSVPMTTRVAVDAEVEWYTQTMGMTMAAGRRPLTVSADYTEGGGCGRVVFSSYEVDNRAASSAAPLTPQERVLEYMLFELGGCLVTPG